MDYPENLIRQVDHFRVSDHILHNFAVDKIIELIHLVIFFGQATGNADIFSDECPQGAVQHRDSHICHHGDLSDWDGDFVIGNLHCYFGYSLGIVANSFQLGDNFQISSQ